MRNEFLWVEKYRPKTIEDCILPTSIKKTFQDLLQKISLRPSHFKQLVDTKSSSSTKLITQQTTYNSYLGRLQRSFLATADSSLPATSKTKSSNPSTVDAPVLTFQPIPKASPNLPPSSSNVSKKSWIQKVLNMITRSW
jgi:hypothetical protein